VGVKGLIVSIETSANKMKDILFQQMMRRHLSLLLNKVIITQPQAEVFPLQFGSNQSKELQRRSETRALLTPELNLQYNTSQILHQSKQQLSCG